MTVPPYAVAALSIGLFAWAAARYQRRAIFIIIAGILAILGKFLAYYTRLGKGLTNWFRVHHSPSDKHGYVHTIALAITANNGVPLSWKAVCGRLFRSDVSDRLDTTKLILVFFLMN